MKAGSRSSSSHIRSLRCSACVEELNVFIPPFRWLYPIFACSTASLCPKASTSSRCHASPRAFEGRGRWAMETFSWIQWLYCCPERGNQGWLSGPQQEQPSPAILDPKLNFQSVSVCSSSSVNLAPHFVPCL